MPDLHEQCLDELVKTAQGLKLDGYAANTIRKRRLEYTVESDGRMTFKHLEEGITFFPTQETEAAGTTGRNDIGYGCGCVIVAGSAHGQSQFVGRPLEARAKIRRKVIDQKLSIPLLTGAYYLTTKVSHLPINQPQEAHRREASSLLIRCWLRESRG